MAEAIGLVASVIAIGQVAAAVGKVTIRLRNLWGQVKDVPDQISDLLRELEMLDPLLKEFDKRLAQNDLPREVWDDSSANLSRIYCQEAMEKLCSMANELDRKLEKSGGKFKRNFVSAKMIFNKDTLERHEKKLQKAMGLLQSSMHCYSMAMSRATYEMMRSLPAKVSADLEAAVQESHAETTCKVQDGGDEDNSDQSSPQEFCNPRRRETFWSGYFGSITYRPSADGKSRRVRFQPPLWLTQSIWELELRRAYSGWQQINLRVYNTRRSDSEVFRVVMYGDFDQLIEMFDKGEASPFDCNPQGESLLHYATRQSHVEICRVLLESGLYSCIDEQITDDGSPRSMTLCWDFSYAGTLIGGYATEVEFLKNKIAIMDLFWKFGFDDYAYSDGLGWEVDFLSQLQCQHISSYHTLPLKHRLLAARNNVYREQWRHYRSDALGYLINKDCRLRREDIKESVKEGISLIHTCALALGGMSGAAVSWTFDEWNQLARDIISASTIDELHTVEECAISKVAWQDNWTGTPLISLFHGLAVRPKEKDELRDCIHFGLRNWLKQLHERGINLVQYGRREKAYLSRHFAETRERVQATFEIEECGGRYKQPMELRDIKYGPEPDDWVVLWDLDIYRMTGEFLKMAEPELEPEQASVPRPRYRKTKKVKKSHATRSPKMPGQWVD